MREIDSHSDRRWYLVSYDIRDPKRWRLAYKQLKGCGERIQYSLFRCRLSRTEMERLRWRPERLGRTLSVVRDSVRQAPLGGLTISASLPWQPDAGLEETALDRVFETLFGGSLCAAEKFN
jgi:CRISPR-associated endonuclease Cas2